MSLPRTLGLGIMTLAVAALAILPPVGGAGAAELKVLSGNGGRAAIRELCSRFEKETGNKLSLRFEVNAEIKRKIDAGEEFDVALLNPPVIDALIQTGKILASSRADIGHAGIGLAVRAGAEKPDIASTDAFKRALLGAKSVAFPGQGASGVYFVNLLHRLGIAEPMKPKLRPMPAEDTVEVVARGEAEMVVVIASRIVDVPGVELVGLIPAELQTSIGITAGISVAARDADTARELIRFLTAPAAAPILKSKGITPD
jgi:molybdate transport system substrate-binding protein